MVNTDDFTKRLEVVFEYYGLNASAFADKIGVQRSSLSHLLSGRNKPSLDFILKMLEHFPEIDLYWILNGKGKFPRESKSDTSVEKQSDVIPNVKREPAPSSFVDQSEPRAVQPKEPSVEKTEQAIDKIIVFYTDGTFSEYRPK